MSFKKDHLVTIQAEALNNYTANKTEAEIKNLFADILQNGVHGFCFSL